MRLAPLGRETHLAPLRKTPNSLSWEHTIVTTSAVALRTCIRLFRAMQIYLSDCGGT